MTERISDERLAEIKRTTGPDVGLSETLMMARELAELREQVRWRPMEEAPKDQRILLRMSGHIACGRWCDDRHAKKPRPFWDWDSALGKSWVRSDQPAGWMPLPEIGPLPGGDA